MKEFWIYTGLRVLLFAASLGVVVGVWFIFSSSVPVLWAVVIAFAMSGVGSYFLLDRQREAFARRVQVRAERMTSRIEESRAKEDADDA